MPVVSQAPQLPRGGAPSTSVGPSSADWSTLATTLSDASAELVLPDASGGRSAAIRALFGECELLAAARVLGDVQPVDRRLEVVRLVDLGEGLDRVVVALDQDRQRVDHRRIVGSRTIFQIRPFVEREWRCRRNASGRCSRCPGRSRPGRRRWTCRAACQRHVLDADELEDVVAGRSSARGPTADRRCPASPCCRGAPGRRCQVPSVGGVGYGPPSSLAGTSADIMSSPSAFRPVAISLGTSMNWPLMLAAEFLGEIVVVVDSSKRLVGHERVQRALVAQTSSASSAMYA